MDWGWTAESYMEAISKETYHNACSLAGELSLLLSHREVPLEVLDFIKERLDIEYQSVRRHRSH
jgi:hypothetical protein